MILLLEEFYSLVYSLHPRCNEWTKDKDKKHQTAVTMSQAETNRYTSQYLRKPALLPEFICYLVCRCDVFSDLGITNK